MQPATAVLWAFRAGMVILTAVAAAAAKGEEQQATLWRHVLVEPLWLKPSVTQQTRDLSLVSCGVVCMWQDWCRLWCHVAPRECLLTSLFVSASYTPAQPEGAQSCHTSHLPDLAVGAAITSSPHYDSTRQKENLVDGIYGNDNLDCSVVVPGNGGWAWFMLDLGAEHPISEVVLVAQPSSYAQHYFKDIEVRVGSVGMVGDFSTYQLLGTYMGPGKHEEVAVVRPAAPITGRYVSIQRTTDGYLMLAHVEIR